MTVDEEYTRTVECTYKNRKYLVRDNGAIYRIAKDTSKPSKWDNKWTFGVQNKQNGYMFIAGSIRVHQVVCTAFHGAPTEPEMVVDHCDTNRCNNRPENLRWLTKPQNALCNDATRRKIIYYCGSVEAFLDNPAILRDKALPPDISWMKTVTPEQAEECKKYMEEWAKRDVGHYVSKDSSGGISPFVRSKPGLYYGNTLRTLPKNDYPLAEIKLYEENQHIAPRWECRVISQTIASLFPYAPLASISQADVLVEYQKSLKKGQDFLISRYFKTVVEEVRLFPNNNVLRVLSQRTNGNQFFYLFEVWPEDGILYHKKIGTYITKAYYKAISDLGNLSLTSWTSDVCYSYLIENRKIKQFVHPLPLSLR